MVYIRKVKTKSGATAVQVAYTAYGKIIRVDHIGNAHNPAELELLNVLAKTKLAVPTTPRILTPLLILEGIRLASLVRIQDASS